MLSYHGETLSLLLQWVAPPGFNLGFIHIPKYTWGRPCEAYSIRFLVLWNHETLYLGLTDTIGCNWSKSWASCFSSKHVLHTSNTTIITLFLHWLFKKLVPVFMQWLWRQRKRNMKHPHLHTCRMASSWVDSRAAHITVAENLTMYV